MGTGNRDTNADVGAESVASSEAHQHATVAQGPWRRMSRRRLLMAAGGGVVAVAGTAALYEALARRATAPVRVVPPANGYPAGQYQIAEYGMKMVTDTDSGVQVNVPPIWNMVVTATLTRKPGHREQQRLEAALRAVEAAYSYSPAGVFAEVAYGLPYFRTYVPAALVDAHLPRMADAGAATVLLDAMRFSDDPASTILEANDVAFHLRSDVLDHLQDVRYALFERRGTLAGQPAPAADLSDLFHITSVRTGFVGAGLPRQMAQQAGLKIAESIPAAAPLFMGFTSTQHSGQATEAAVSFEQPPDPLLKPLTTAHPGDYFAGGTCLHVSHLIEDLESWYALTYEQRVARMFHLNVATAPGRVSVQTLWLNPNTSAIDAQQNQLIGHNEAVQRNSRTPEGQALQLRVDFNTMDALDAPGPTTGLHFLAYTPGSQIFHLSRQAMNADDLTQRYHVAPQADGINSFIRATRRQNFLVPPRRHRAFPLIELS